MSHYILGVDPSFTGTGWSIFEPVEKRCEDWGCIKTDTSNIDIVRFKIIKKTIQDLVKKYNINEAGCEAPVFGGYATGTLFALNIILQEIFLDYKVDVVFLAPLQIHKVLKFEGYGINGKIFKSDSVKAAKDFLKDIVPNKATGDKADSFHAARIGSRFWDLLKNRITENDLNEVEKDLFQRTHTFVKGSKKGSTEKKGLAFRENDLFFRFATFNPEIT